MDQTPSSRQILQFRCGSNAIERYGGASNELHGELSFVLCLENNDLIHVEVNERLSGHDLEVSVLHHGRWRDDAELSKERCRDERCLSQITPR